jgi:hypothetical protein
MKSRFLLNRAGDYRFLNLDGGVLVGRAPKSRHHAMPTKDGFAPGHPLPRFLSEHADEPDRLRVVEARNRTGISSRFVLNDEGFDRNGNSDRNPNGGRSGRALYYLAA